MAYCNLMDGNLPEAELNYLKIYTQQPMYLPAIFNLANINTRRGNYLKAINYLHEKKYFNFKGLFVGNGNAELENKIKSSKGCFLIPFVNSIELPSLYQMADIGIWPKQESTSQLDALACGLPIIISNNVEDHFRTENCGKTYIENDYVDLANQILSLTNKSVRIKLGNNGNKKINDYYSWDILAENKIFDFKNL